MIQVPGKKRQKALETREAEYSEDAGENVAHRKGWLAVGGPKHSIKIWAHR